MKINWQIIYIYALIFSTILSLIFTRISLALGNKLGMMDQPGERKVHTHAKPRSGGIAIYSAFILTIIFHIFLWFLFFKNSLLIHENVDKYLINIPQTFPKILAILSGATLLFITGIIDDKKPLPPIPKLIIQIIAGIMLFAAGIKIKFFFDSQIFSLIITVGWVVFLTNSFNFLDNMDGLTAGVACIVCFNLALISYLANEYFMVIIFMIFIGSMLGFLKYNFYPSKIFMGDSGSLFIGFIIASLTILSTYYEKGIPNKLSAITPLIVLSLPLFDTISVMSIRYKNKKPLMVGDKNHFSHRLVDLGMTQKGAVVFIYFITLVIGLNTLSLRKASLPEGILILCQTFLLFVIIFLLEHIPRRER